jgi:antitoxin ParD1/3/4
MNVSIGERWEGFVESAVRSGRYGSASEVVREGLRLVEEREAKLSALRNTLKASIAEGGSVSDDDLAAALDAKAASLVNESEDIRTRASVRRAVDGEPPRRAGVLKSLRNSPMVDAELYLDRAREPSRDTDL